MNLAPAFSRARARAGSRGAARAQGGWIYILDLQGNEVRRFASHTAVVNALAFDRAGDAVASCSDDGTVVINGLSTPECASFTYQRPVRALALDPKFERKGNRQFASGGLAAQLLLNEKGWFSTKDKVVHSGEGPVGAVAWEGSLIAWANDMGVKIFDVATNQRITYIDRPKGSARADVAQCHLEWESPAMLLIGWADFVKIAQVRERPAREGVPAQRYVEIVAFFHTDFTVLPPTPPPPPHPRPTPTCPPSAPPPPHRPPPLHPRVGGRASADGGPAGAARARDGRRGRRRAPRAPHRLARQRRGPRPLHVPSRFTFPHPRPAFPQLYFWLPTSPPLALPQPEAPRGGT